MYLLFMIIISVSSCSCSSAKKATEAPVTVTASPKIPAETTTVIPQSKPESVLKQNSSTIGSSSVKRSRSQKDMLGSFGTMGSSNKKTEVEPAKTAPSQKSLLGLFGFLEKPVAKQEAPIPATKSAADNTKTKTNAKPDKQSCDVTDMCLTMNGICNHGTCVHVVKDCVADIKCECEAGYQGQFCSVAIATTTVTKADVTTASTTTVTMSTTTAKTTPKSATSKPKKNSGKHLVNGSIDMAKVISDYTSTGKVIGHDVINEAYKDKYHKNSNTQLKKSNDNDNGNGNGNHDMVTGQNSVKHDNGKVVSFRDNGNGHSNTDTTGQKHNTNGNGSNGNSNTSNGNNGNGNANSKSLAESVSKDGSYRKGPEATLIANNNPISLETTRAISHKIKRGRVSVIDKVTDTVTLATFTVKKTFIGAVKQQTERVNDKHNKSKKQKEELQINRKQKQLNKMNKIQTTAAPQTNNSRHTKVVIIDSSNNMTINVLSNVHVKTQEQIVVTETNGSVNILIKNADTNITKASNMTDSVESIVPKDPTAGTSSTSLASQSIESHVKDMKRDTPVEVLNIKGKSQKRKIDGQPSNMVNIVSKENTKTDNASVAVNKQANKESSTKHSNTGKQPETPSVFSPIIKLLKDLQSSEVMQNSLGSAKKGKPSHTETEAGNINATVKQMPHANSPNGITATQMDIAETPTSLG